jgi:SAM-dependent methyltransferase
MENVVGAQHEFHDNQYARDWSDRFIPTPERLQLFDAIIDRITESSLPSRHIVELGIGPGYLAERLLEALSEVTYEGVDFSHSMLELAAARLASHASRVQFTQADLTTEDWGERISRPVGAIVSTWALHDLGSEKNTRNVYQSCHRLLPEGGMLLNGDFVKPNGAKHEYETGRFLVSRHLEILQEVGFRETQCLIMLEEELENPTAATNYACLQAVA